MCDPHHHFSSSTSSSYNREPRRFSYAGTTSSNDSGQYSGYSVSSILQGSESSDHLMDSMSSMSGGSHGSHIDSSSTPETDQWIHHTTPPHSAPPISRNDPFEYFQHPVTCQASLPTFQEAYVSNASVSLRPPLWPHPFRSSVVGSIPGNLLAHHDILPSWTSVPSSSSGMPPSEAYHNRLNLPWNQEPAKFGSDFVDPLTMFAAGAQQHAGAQHHHVSVPSSGHASDSSSDAGSVSSPVMSPSYYGGSSSQSSAMFSFAGGRHDHMHSALHRTKSSPTSFGRSENDSSGQVCAVCGDHAACQHYGVR